MKKIFFEKIWFDNDSIELKILVADDESAFYNTVYSSNEQMQNTSSELNDFRSGICDIKFGEFGHDLANGAFHAHLNIMSPGTVFVSTHQQCDFCEFNNKNIASESKLFLKTEPVLLDTFIKEFKSLSVGNRNDATLRCI